MDPIKLEDAIEKKCKNHVWLVWILFLTASPISFNASHLASYVFLGGDPTFFCNIPELVEANWTKEQIREISSPGMEKNGCVHYAWNYTLLKELGFDEALIYYNITQKPDVIRCKSYIYDEETVHHTIVSEWDLVCDDMPLRSTAQGSVAAGKFLGATILGLFSDSLFYLLFLNDGRNIYILRLQKIKIILHLTTVRFGRKKMFIFASTMYMIVAPTAAFLHSYWIFIMFRFFIGIAGAGIYEISYTLLMELTVKKYRIYLGNIFNIFYSFGLIYLPVAAYFTNNWRQLQMAISVPMFALIIHCWFLPESPRWLITRGKLQKASNIIGSACLLDYNEPPKTSNPNIMGQSDSCLKNVQFIFKDYLKLFSTLELAKRTLICYYLSFMADLSYFIIALNATNFEVDPYLYMGLNGIIDLPGCLVPIFLLTHFGRKSSAIALYTISGISMVLITVIPQGLPIMIVTLIARITGIAAMGTGAFFKVELFPTEHRNTVVGSCVAVSQLGPLLAPHVVEIGGKTFWWVPTVLCGFLACLGALLLMFIPETRDTPLLDTINEMKKQEKESLQIF